MERIKVLLVDDHTLFRTGIRQLLMVYPDLEIVGEAETGEEAVECVVATKPDVVLMDIDMPGMGGVAATAQIHTTDPEQRVLLLTGHRRYTIAGLRAGASGYLLKNADEDVMLAAIRAVASGGVYLPRDVQAQLAKELQGNVVADLSERELAILRLVAEGQGNREIANHLGLSERRIKQHITDILSKLDATDRAHAVALAIRQGLL